ncbi:carboxyl-terminal protease [Sphingobacterium sp. N143]|uniref:S41 family peptidase n=1 Tax=Sphingobacterium sp. N143 TaxID=2746727 RepID=UPI002576233B|nr:S41 family peptidase [Sphingobacterium sp. N143]MDM1293486.1 carboxyl-terminal protease [Sphingobacterium sp. N143]
MIPALRKLSDIFLLLKTESILSSYITIMIFSSNTHLKRINFSFLLITFFTSLSISSCQKHYDPDEDNIPRFGSRTELTIDSIYLYAKEIYLWNDALPSYNSFSPRNKYAYITPEINALEKELYDISQLKINEKTKFPFEYTESNVPKYSYLETNFNYNFKTRAAASSKVENDNITTAYIDNVAYVAIHSFPQLQTIKSDLDDIFVEVAEQQPSTIVIDLRYNRGGYIETVEYLANLIIPSRLNDKVMYSESFNTTLSTGHAKILRHQPYVDNNGNYVQINGRQATLADVDYSEKGNTYLFNKKGRLETIENIYFITSRSTASASELLISLFKPYFKVKLVGQKTYGKPVGFFAVNIDQYSIYLSSFLLKNADGWFDYFNGIVPNITVALPISPNLGDPQELGLKYVLDDLFEDDNKSSMSKRALKLKSKKYQINIEKDLELSIENRLRLR